jgi:secreted trypsin-like serine protease
MSAMGRRRFAVLACLASALLAAPAGRAQSPEPRIIGGSTTTIEQYPWQAAVVYDSAKVGGNPFQRQFCGGSLITPYIVLTAAHCVFDTDPQNNSSLDEDDVNIVLGQTTLSTAPPGSEFDVQGVAYQDNYDDSYGPGQGVPSNDVGYIVLQSPYNATTPIDIAGSDEGALWDSTSPEQITGWGATAESGPGSGGSDTLRVATVPIVADSSCTADYGVYFNSSSMVCAGYPEGGIDTCYGDSGGPMQAALDGGGYRLVGITSWGEGCAQPDAPGVYTRVAGESLRPAVASKVFDLETAFELPHENVIGGADTDPPETSITSGPSGPTNDSTPTFGFSSDEPGSSFQCRFDTDPFGPCSDPGGSHTPAAPLADGVHTFGVRATDASDNTDPTPASRGFTVDTVAPSDPTLSSPSHTINVASTDPTVEVSFSGAADGLSGVDGFSYQWSTAPTTVPDTTKDAEETATGTTSPALPDGNSHYFHLRTRDNAGNWTSTVHLGPFVIEGQPPAAPTITDTDPDSPANDNDPELKGTVGAGDPTQVWIYTNAGCTGSVDATGTVAQFTGAGITVSVPDDATTPLSARAVDAGSTGSACSSSFDYTEDSTPPSDPTLSSPSHTVGVASNDPTVEVSFSGAADGLSGVDGFSYQWSTSPTTVPDTTMDAAETATGITSPTLPDGNSHYFHLRTRDNAGNWTSTVHLGPFVIDTQAPSLPPPMTPPPVLSSPPDSAPPNGRLSAKLRQGVGGITLQAGCDEDCTAVATGLVIAEDGSRRALASTSRTKFKLTAARAEIAAGGSATLKVKPKGKTAQRRLRKLVRRGAGAKAKINVTFTDRAGNSIAEKLIVKLER